MPTGNSVFDKLRQTESGEEATTPVEEHTPLSVMLKTMMGVDEFMPNTKKKDDGD
jgi:hypothetical protein